MTQQTKKTPASKAAAVQKPPKKLIPRTAPKLAAQPADDMVAPIVAPGVVQNAVAKSATAKPVAAKVSAPKAVAARKATKVDETVAKHQKELADALVKAQAIKYDQAAPVKPVVAKAVKAKAKKVKLVRDSYAMPENEYAQIGVLKKRMVALGSEVKKSELLRGGIAALVALSDAELKAVMGRVERIKTGRPAK